MTNQATMGPSVKCFLQPRANFIFLGIRHSSGIFHTAHEKPGLLIVATVIMINLDFGQMNNLKYFLKISGNNPELTNPFAIISQHRGA